MVFYGFLPCQPNNTPARKNTKKRKKTSGSDDSVGIRFCPIFNVSTEYKLTSKAST